MDYGRIRFMENIKTIQSRYSYEPLTGIIRNKRTGKIVDAEERGYVRRVWIDGDRYQPTHIIWAIAFGHFPKYEIDHIDDNGLNNKLENLQDVPHAINIGKTSLRKSGNSVKLDLIYTDGKWLLFIIWKDGSNRFEFFSDINDAIATRLEWEQDITLNRLIAKPEQIRADKKPLDWLLGQHPKGWMVSVKIKGDWIEKIFKTEQEAEAYKRAWVNL